MDGIGGVPLGFGNLGLGGGLGGLANGGLAGGGLAGLANPGAGTMAPGVPGMAGSGSGAGMPGLGGAGFDPSQLNPLASILTGLSGGAIGPSGWSAAQLPIQQQAAALSGGYSGRGGGGMSPQDTLAMLLAGTMT
jgi:hypothetical protein